MGLLYRLMRCFKTQIDNFTAGSRHTEDFGPQIVRRRIADLLVLKKMAWV